LAIERGSSIREAARRFNVSPATAHKHWHRWRRASGAERRTLSCLHDRSSRPHRSPNELPEAAQERICEVREHTGWGPRLIPGVVGHPHSTVHRTLQRRGISRRPRPAREEVVRYEWPCPGDLLHMDTKRYSRFERPGHAVHGDRSRRNRRVGYEWVHSVVDDHSRFAHSELHPDERSETVVGFLERVLADYRGRGMRVRRLMTDNHFSYTKSVALGELLAREGIRHITTQPYRPQTNGKVERFQQTMAREWAYGLAYACSDDRARAMAHWVRYYNEQRPHSAIGDRPPISRVHDLSGQDS
jgi:transposase InsO family protein